VYSNFRSHFLGMYARRYSLMHSHLFANTSSAVDSVCLASREVLANTARQCLEIHQYMTKFFDDVTSRAGVVGADWSYSARANFVTSRVVLVFADAVCTSLSEDTAIHRSVRILHWLHGSGAALAKRLA
jgi:hypothetical protein